MHLVACIWNFKLLCLYLAKLRAHYQARHRWGLRIHFDHRGVIKLRPIHCTRALPNSTPMGMRVRRLRSHSRPNSNLSGDVSGAKLTYCIPSQCYRVQKQISLYERCSVRAFIVHAFFFSRLHRFRAVSHIPSAVNEPHPLFLLFVCLFGTSWCWLCKFSQFCCSASLFQTAARSF